MKPTHLLAATLSLGGILAAVSGTHAMAFDPIAAPRGGAPSESDDRLASFPGAWAAFAQIASWEKHGEPRSAPNDVLRADHRVLPMIYPVKAFLGGGGEVPRPAAAEAVLDLDASRRGL